MFESPIPLCFSLTHHSDLRGTQVHDTVVCRCRTFDYPRLRNTCPFSSSRVTPGISRHTHPEGEPCVCIYRYVSTEEGYRSIAEM